MKPRSTKRIEGNITDSYAPFNILAMSQDDERVVISALDFEKLLACRDIVLFALHGEKDVPYSLVEKMTSSFGSHGHSQPRK